MPPGIRLQPYLRLTAFQQAHPDVEISPARAGGVWHAWIPAPDGGREVARCHLAELLDRLAELTGWDG